MPLTHAPLLAFVAVAVALVAGCQAELAPPAAPATAAEWVAASARRHDPAARWPAFRAEVHVATTLPGGGTYTNAVLLDRARDTFRRRAVAGPYTLEQSVGPTGACYATYDKPDAPPAELARAGVGVDDPCAVFGWRRGYYDFLVGLPMSALGGGGGLSFGGAGGRVDTVVFGEPAVEVRLDYPAQPGEPTWWLYVSPLDFRLVAARFRRPRGGGEWLHYPMETTFDGFVLRAAQHVYRLDGAPLSEEALTYARPES